MGPEVNTNRLALVLNIVPSSEITKFNDANHQKVVPLTVIGRLEVDFTCFIHSIVCLSPLTGHRRTARCPGSQC